MAITVWGHRGCRGPGNPPENSLAALRAAMDQGAGGVELDLLLSRDEKLVVFHDDTLERMTDGTGSISTHSFAGLRALKLKDVSGKPTGEIIPSFDDVLDALTPRLNHHFVLNAEIKGLGLARYVVQAIEQRLRQGWQPHHFLVSSFDMESLREVRALDPALPVGVLLCASEAPYNISEAMLQSRLAEIHDIKPETVNITYPSLTPGAIDLIRQTGAAPVAWTYNEVNPNGLAPAQRQRMVKNLKDNAIVLITDYPGEMIALLKGEQ